MEFKGVSHICGQKDANGQKISRHLMKNRTSSSTCIYDTNSGVLNFKTSVETTVPCSVLKGGIGSWKRNFRPSSSETLDERGKNQTKIISSSVHQQQPTTQVSQDTHQSPTDLISPFYQAEHNEFILNDMQNLLTNRIESSSNTNTRNSQNFSIDNSHMYL